MSAYRCSAQCQEGQRVALSLYFTEMEKDLKHRYNFIKDANTNIQHLHRSNRQLMNFYNLAKKAESKSKNFDKALKLGYVENARKSYQIVAFRGRSTSSVSYSKHSEGDGWDMKTRPTRFLVPFRCAPRVASHGEEGIRIRKEKTNEKNVH